jgi:hypothetical protein
MLSMSSVISPSADSIKNQLILPSRRSSTKFLRSSTSPHVFRRQLTCYGFQPSRDFTSTRLRFARRPPVLRFDPSSGFRNLSTVSSAFKLAGLFHPAATPRVRSRSGASLPSQPSALIERLCLHAVAAPSLANFVRLASSAHCWVSRPRAMPLSFEALLCERPRSLGSGYSPRPMPLPSSSFNCGSIFLSLRTVNRASVTLTSIFEPSSFRARFLAIAFSLIRLGFAVLSFR